MSLRVDLEKSLEALHSTIHKLDDDIRKLEELVSHHFDLNSKPVPPRVMQNVSEDLSRLISKDLNALKDPGGV